MFLCHLNMYFYIGGDPLIYSSLIGWQKMSVTLEWATHCKDDLCMKLA